MSSEGKSTQGGETCRPEDVGGRQASRVLLTGLFALLGAKITAFVATHLIMGKQIYESAQKNLTWEARIKKFLNFGDALGTGRQFHRNLIITGASMVAGAIGGAIIGRLRGHRIRQPKDIIEHPLRTIKTIAMSERSYQEREKAACEQASTAWQDKAHSPTDPQRGMDRA